MLEPWHQLVLFPGLIEVYIDTILEEDHILETEIEG